MLLHTNHVRLTDKKIKTIATKRYESDIEKAHKTLYEFYKSQDQQFHDKKSIQIR